MSATGASQAAPLMLCLASRTDPSWVDAVEGNLSALLADHAHCELKAAQSALSLVGRFGGDVPTLVTPLTALAREETEHFRQVHEQMAARQASLHPPSADAYVAKLRQAQKALRPRVPALLDRLLVSALIEARSCERFLLLAERLEAAELRAFYRELMKSEARHYQLFRSLAESAFGGQDSRTRLTDLAEEEAQIASALPLGPSVHG